VELLSGAELAEDRTGELLAVGVAGKHDSFGRTLLERT
jgi:hypothetical protein